MRICVSLGAIFALLIIASCSKEKRFERRFAGTYIGMVEEYSQSLGQPPYTNSFADTLTATISKKTVHLDNGWSFHVDSLDKTNYYRQGPYGNYQSVQFISDSVIYGSYHVSPGGNGSYLFSGKKQ